MAGYHSSVVRPWNTKISEPANKSFVQMFSRAPLCVRPVWGDAEWVCSPELLSGWDLFEGPQNDCVLQSFFLGETCLTGCRRIVVFCPRCVRLSTHLSASRVPVQWVIKVQEITAITCETGHVRQGLWDRECGKLYVRHGMWGHACETLHLRHCMWDRARDYIWDNPCSREIPNNHQNIGLSLMLKYPLHRQQTIGMFSSELILCVAA